MPANAFTVLPDEFNAATYFVDRHIAEGRGKKTAIECEERIVTYQQLFEMVNRAGNYLRKLGVRIEERVFLLLFDTPEFAASFFGAIKGLSRGLTSSISPTRYLRAHRRSTPHRPAKTMLHFGCTRRAAPVDPKLASICNMTWS